jgi:hypothetical protein
LSGRNNLYFGGSRCLVAGACAPTTTLWWWGWYCGVGIGGGFSAAAHAAGGVSDGLLLAGMDRGVGSQAYFVVSAGAGLMLDVAVCL